MDRQSVLIGSRGRYAITLLIGCSLLGCSSSAATKKRCEELDAKATQFAEGPEMNGARSLDDVRRAFDKQAKLLDDAEAACRDAKDLDRVAGMQRGRQALATMRLKAENDTRAKLEAGAAKQLDAARESLGKAKSALKKSDYKAAAPLLIAVVVSIAEAERTRDTCIGLVDAGACGDGGAPSPNVERALTSTMSKSYLEHGSEGGIIRGPKSKEAAALVDEVHALWTKHAAQLNAALAQPAAEPGTAKADDAVEAKVRGELHDAELLVPQHIREQLADPDSYEYVEGFGTGTPKGPFWVVTWTWKATNALGAKVQNTKTFCVSAGSPQAVIPCTR